MLEGGAALSFSAEDPNSFVVGLEAGQLFKGSLLGNELRSAKVIRTMNSDVPWTSAAAGLLTRVPAAHFQRLKMRVEKEAVLSRAKEVAPRQVYSAQPDASVLFQSPIMFSYDAHSGPVYAASFSPFHRNVFLSVSTDSSARLFNMLQPRPVHITEPSSSSLYSCSWSPVRPLVFAVAAADGHLYIYDLKRNKGKPQVDLKVTSNRSPVYAVAFNPKAPELVATADGQGFVKVWRLSGDLSTMAPREQELLDKMMAARGVVDTPEEEAGEEDGEANYDDDYDDDDQ